MTKSDKKALVKNANEAYYNGNKPILTDAEYDLLTDMDPDASLDVDVSKFRKKVTHVFPIKGLRKIKDPIELAEWIRVQNSPIVYSPKLDGISLEIVYYKGNLRSISTRGNGLVGYDITDKARYLNIYTNVNLPYDLIVVRAEVVTFIWELLEKSQSITSKLLSAEPSSLAKLNNSINIVSFDVLGECIDSYETKKQILSYFYLGPAEQYIPASDNINTPLSLYEYLRRRFVHHSLKSYRTNGLVLEAVTTGNTVAVKFDDSAEAIIGSIEWNMGFQGHLAPVLVLENPVIINGINIQRVNVSNYSILKNLKLGIGARVGVAKSHVYDSPPYISDIYESSTTGLKLPVCSLCNTTSVLRKYHACCNNTDCAKERLSKLQHLFSVLEIDNISDATVEMLFNAGYQNLRDIYDLSVDELSAIDGFSDEAAEYLHRQLRNLELSEEAIIECADLPNIDRKQGKKLIEHYGNIENFISEVQANGLDDIKGFDDTHKALISEGIDKVRDCLDLFVDLDAEILSTEASPIVVCCTGKHPTLYRYEYRDILVSRGFIVSDTWKKPVEILICADKNSTSSKMAIAMETGIPIMTYDEFEDKYNIVL